MASISSMNTMQGAFFFAAWGDQMKAMAHSSITVTFEAKVRVSVDTSMALAYVSYTYFARTQSKQSIELKHNILRQTTSEERQTPPT